MNRIEIENNERELIAERLLNLLPHGSGINGDWTIFQKSDKDFIMQAIFIILWTLTGSMIDAMTSQ